MKLIRLSSLAAVAMFVTFSCTNETPPQPVDTQVLMDMEDESETEHLLKEAYFNSMRRTTDGLDPNTMDAQTRFRKYVQFARNRSQIQSDSVILAGGELAGKWSEKGSSNQSGRVMFAAMDTINSKVYVLSAGGVAYRGNVDGTDWEPLNDRLAIGSPRAFFLLNHNGGIRIVASGSKDCYYSDDNGLTWQKSLGLNSVHSWGSIRNMLPSKDDSSSIYALVQNWNYDDWHSQINVYRSTDNGATFNPILSEQAVHSMNKYSIWSSAFEQSDLYFQAADSTFVWSDSQQQFLPAGALPNGVASGVSLTGSTQGSATTLFAYADQQAYTSTNGGQSWSTGQNLGFNPFMSSSVWMGATDNQQTMVGGVDCYQSSNGGSSFALINHWYEYYQDPVNFLHADIPSISSWIDASGDEHVFICTDGGLFVSDDFGQTVVNISMDGLNISQYYTVYTNRIDSNYVYAGAQDQGFQRSNLENDSILEFEQLISGDYAHLVSSDSGQSIWYLYPGFIVYSENPTQNWSSGTADFDGRNHMWMPPLCAHPTDRRKCFMAGKDVVSEEPVIYLVEYDGSDVNYSIHNSDFGSLGAGKLSAIEVSPFDSQIMYVLTEDGQNFISYDGGQSFQAGGLSSGPEMHYFYGASIYPSVYDSGVVYFAGNGYNNPGVWKSTDHGLTAIPMVDSLPQTLVHAITGGQGDSVLYAATEVGPYAYIASEGRWFDLAEESAPQQNYWAVEYIREREIARFGTYGRGIWDFDMKVLEEDSDTSSSTVAERIADRDIYLWPNPASTNIYIDLSEYSNQPFSIFNLQGKLMVQGQLSKESIDISQLPSGVYIFATTHKGRAEYLKFIKTE